MTPTRICKAIQLRVNAREVLSVGAVASFPKATGDIAAHHATEALKMLIQRQRSQLGTVRCIHYQNSVTSYTIIPSRRAVSADNEIVNLYGPATNNNAPLHTVRSSGRMDVAQPPRSSGNVSSTRHLEGRERNRRHLNSVDAVR